MDESATDDETIRATLELVRDEPLRGSITLDGVERPFTGWLELAIELTELRKGARRPSTRSPSTT